MWFSNKPNLRKCRWTHCDKNPTNRKLVEDVVRRALAIDAEKWQGSAGHFRTISEHGCCIDLKQSRSADEDGSQTNYTLFVDEEQVAEYRERSYRDAGYDGVKVLYDYVSQTRSALEAKRKLPFLLAEQAANRLKAEQEVEQQIRVEKTRLKDILRRL
jgi:hypothetical protein